MASLGCHEKLRVEVAAFYGHWDRGVRARGADPIQWSSASAAVAASGSAAAEVVASSSAEAATAVSWKDARL